VSLEKLIQIWRVELGLEGKEWLCMNCRYGMLPDEDVCGYVFPPHPHPLKCIYVEHRMRRVLRQLLGPPEDED